MRRTRKLLQGALGTLMQSKSFDEISVQDITETATVNRATFYDHYTDKFALLEAMVAGGFHEFLDERQLRYQAGCPQALGAIILATCDFLVQVHSAGACERQTAFEPLMNAAIATAIRRLLLEGLEHARPTLPAELIAASASAAITAGVKQWLVLQDRSSTSVIVSQLLQLVLPMMGASSRAELSIAAAAHRH